MIDINTLWNDTKIKLSARLQAISYEVWIEKLEPICFIGHTLVLQTGSQSSKNTIVKNYRETILEAVKEVNPIISDVKIIIESEKADCLKQQDYTLGDELVVKKVEKSDDAGFSFNKNIPFQTLSSGNPTKSLSPRRKPCPSIPAVVSIPCLYTAESGLEKPTLCTQSEIT